MRVFNNIAKLVSNRRQNLGLTQTELSIMVGFKNGQFVSNIERGLCSIPAKDIVKLADGLKINSSLIVEAMVLDYKETLSNFANISEPTSLVLNSPLNIEMKKSLSQIGQIL